MHNRYFFVNGSHIKEQLKPFSDPRAFVAEHHQRNWARKTIIWKHLHAFNWINSSWVPAREGSPIKEGNCSWISRFSSQGYLQGLMCTEISPSANLLTEQSVLATKAQNHCWGAFQGKIFHRRHRDILNAFLVHGWKTLQPISFYVNVPLAAISNFKIWPTDVKLAYLLANEPLQRRIDICDLAVELDLEVYMALQLIKPLFSLSDSGDVLYETLDTHNK